MSNSFQTQIKNVKNATQNYALKRDLIINAFLTCKYTKELNSFLILYKIRQNDGPFLLNKNAKKTNRV